MSLVADKTKIVIGITPVFDDRHRLVERTSYFLWREYTAVLASVGAVPLILTPDMPLELVLDLCDGIVISGGKDIDQELYGLQNFHNPTVILEPTERTLWEGRMIDACTERGIPILGICYGMQLLNMHFGGRLHHDIPIEVTDAIEHDNVMHDVVFESEFLSFSAGERARVNSRHHQGVSSLADDFTVCARTSDGLIEAIRGNGHYGVQWHPESDQSGPRLYRAFVEHCRQGDGAEDDEEG